ncbi:DUF1961 family protein [Rubellicoccus peritrichatus]|uniref:DUF1961 family protein n=1 Tax=Rubellicoccus peritrichatus TaxID=3080537 RepID=A0AAQ3QX61_9BACT|nr:DUF1961 family protein [Puniceicoccus sp. CR14]WOO42555.1 DUF1961 family protein [Puniceicoccus sp. CR14]
MKPNCCIQHLNNVAQELHKVDGPVRILDLKGMQGINVTSIHSRIRLKEHNLNQERGTVSLWFFSLEDLTLRYQRSCMMANNPFSGRIPFLSDQDNPNDCDSAHFAMFFEYGWHTQFVAKWYRGPLWPDKIDPPQKAMVTSEKCSFLKDRWYQVTLSWDKPKEELRLYYNGILSGVSDRFKKAFYFEQIQNGLIAGSPMLCHGPIAFFDEVLDADSVYQNYRQNAVDYDPEMEANLRHLYLGQNSQPFTWQPDGDWTEKLNLSLKEPDHLESFHLQGYTDAPSILSGEGLLVETPQIPQQSDSLENQVYLWTREVFEGDLYVELDFKPLRPNGLSLLMLQAIGMSREDTLTDYDPPTCGNMDTVHSSDTRNYHWEFYREMNDVRNDLASGCFLKNPFCWPLGYGTLPAPLETNQWHQLKFLQNDDRLIGAINDQIVFDARDSSNTNSGSVYNCGHVVLRCMVNTKVLFRNLRILNGQTAFREFSRQA